MLRNFTYTFTRDYTSNGTGACFTGSDVSTTVSLTDGGDHPSDYDVREWKKKIALGRQATGTYSGNLITLSDNYPGYFYSERYCKSADKWSTESLIGHMTQALGGVGDLACPDAPPTNIGSTTNAQALQKFVRAARNAQGSFRGSTFVAELADTLRGIRNPARGIRDLLDSYKTRTRRNVRKSINRDPYSTRARDLTDRQRNRASRALADSWLELQFGVLPLGSDIRDAARSLNRLSQREPRKPIRASMENTTVPTIVITSTGGVSSVHLQVQWEVHSYSTYQVNYYGAVKLKTETVPSGACEEFGFRVRDFAPALWEWAPWSFLVDYFTNIGDIVEAASFPAPDIAWIGRSWRNTNIRDFTRVRVKPISNAAPGNTGYTRILEFNPYVGTWYRKYFSRAAYEGSIVPRFQIEIPGSKNFRKYLNIAALLHLRGMRR